MHELDEGKLKFNFTDAEKSMKFDQSDSSLPNYHDLNNMPRVDFIVELQDDIYFIEVKDPGQPGAADANSTKFFKKVVDGTLVASLVEKYIFTFLFRWAEVALNKSVHYVCLITLDSSSLLPIMEDLNNQFAQHLNTSSIRWNRLPLASCQVHNITTWTAVFPDWPITRITPTSGAGTP